MRGGAFVLNRNGDKVGTKDRRTGRRSRRGCDEIGNDVTRVYRRNGRDRDYDEYVSVKGRRRPPKRRNIDDDLDLDKGKKTGVKKKKSKFKRFLKFALIILIVFFLVRFIVATYRWRKFSKEMLSNQNSVVLDSNGNVIANIGDYKNKIVLGSDEIPKNIKNAYVAIEDQRFYSHHGVDVVRTGHAIGSYIVHFGRTSFGGSTITQQLVKNMTGDSSDKISRKVTEWWRAWTLESCASKDEVLTAYLNIIYIGPNTYGVGAGAKYYFDKSASELSLEECAFLAGINNSPNSYNPFSKENDHSDLIKKRTKLVLGKMKELNYISKSEYDEAIERLDEGLKFKNGVVDSSDGVYSYHTDAVILEITGELSKKYNMSERFANNYLELAGLKIHSTQVSDIQSEMEKEFEKNKYVIKSVKNEDSSQAAMVMINHKTGQVVACARWAWKEEYF